MPKRKRRIAPRQPNVGSILPVVQRMIAIDALLAGDGLIIDLAAEELGVVGRSVRRSLDILRELANPTVSEIDEATGRTWEDAPPFARISGCSPVHPTWRNWRSK